MKRITKRTLALLLTLVMVIGFMPGNLYASATDGVTIYVDGANGDDANTGETPETAFKTVQAAVASIADDSVPTTILVADGAYNVHDGTSGLNINKRNVTLTKANPTGTVTLYSYVADKFTKIEGSTFHHHGPTVRVSASNVTLDGLTIAPALRGTSDSELFKTAVSASGFQFLAAQEGVTAANVYMPIFSSTIGATVAPLTVSGSLLGIVDNLTVRNCTIGYSGMDATFQYGGANVDSSYAIYFQSNLSRGMIGNYHIEGNTIYGRVYVTNEAGNPMGTASDITNNHFYYTYLYLNIKDDAAYLPLIRGNVLYTPYRTRLDLYSVDWDYFILTPSQKYTDGEASVITKTNRNAGANVYCTYKNPSGISAGIHFVSGTTDTVTVDNVMDSPEELGYYLGQEGTVTLNQSYTITNARMLPNEIKATVDFAGFQITKTTGLDIPAPQGWKWEGDVLVEVPVVSDKTDWITTSLLLNNDLNMRFYVPAEELAEGDYLKVTMEGKEPVELKVWKDGTGNKAGKKYVTFEGIFATEMTAVVEVVLCSADGQAKAGYAVHEDSICKYAERLAASNPEVKWMRLMDAVLNYGAAAQLAAADGEVAPEALPTYGWTWTEPAA